MKDEISTLRRNLALGCLLAAISSPTAFGAAVEISYRPVAGGLPTFSAAIIQALNVQVLALQPALGDPRGMAQVLLQQAHAPESGAGGLASAIILKRSLTDPASYTSVQRSLAATADPVAKSIASGLTGLRESLQPLPQAREAFDRTFKPIEGTLKAGGALEDMGDALDRFFTGATRGSGVVEGGEVRADRPIAGADRSSSASLRPHTTREPSPGFEEPPSPAPVHGVVAESQTRLHAISARADFEPASLLEELKKDPFLRKQYSKPAGVSEGYTLEQHTLMVMRQFERYFPGELPGGADRRLFRLLLALHDIGKPKALEQGDKRLQHERTVEILREQLPRLGFQGASLRLASALVNGDPIGSYLQRGDIERAVSQLDSMAASSGVSRDVFFELLRVFYMSDASSYTRDAGGKASLEYLFVFDRARRTLAFDPEVARRIDRLRDRFLGAGR